MGSRIVPEVFGRPHNQIAVVGHTVEFGVQLNHAIVTHGKGELIAVVEKLKQRLQLVVAIFTAAKDVQHQVELGRGGQGQFLYGHVIAPACAVASP